MEQVTPLLSRIFEYSPWLFLLIIILIGVFFILKNKKKPIVINIGKKKTHTHHHIDISYALGRESVEMENKRLKLQMAESRQMATFIRRLMFGSMLKLLKQKRGGEREDLMEYRETAHYQAVVNDGVKTCLQNLEDMFLVNHFADTSDKEFSIMAKENVNELAGIMTQHLDDYWRGKDIVEAEIDEYEDKIRVELKEQNDSITNVDLIQLVTSYVRDFRKEHMKKAITRIELFEFQKADVLPEVMELLEKTFYKAKDIAIQIKEEALKVDESLEQLKNEEAS